MATLNDDQRAAFLDVLKFINDPDRKEHRVSGGAGTGKSFFISKVVDDILRHTDDKCPLTSVAVTATTNKAAAVLADAMPHRRHDIGTIYSFMNLRVSENYNTGEQKVVPTKMWCVHDNTLIIIDEASMVNSKLKKFIEQGTTKNCKILYVGDKYQLAPVKESLSPVYANKYSESMLLQPVRNAEQPALMELCEQARDTVITGKFHKIKEVPGVIDFVDGNQLQGILEREYHIEDPKKRVLCYTNQRVIQYNTHIRGLRGYGDLPHVGEILSNNSAAELVDKNRMYTDQLVEVLKVGEPYDNAHVIAGHNIPCVDLELRDPSSMSYYEVTIFVEPEDRANVLKYFANNKIWDKYFRTRNQFPDLRSVASSTTHKAQGSTYDSVVVDLADIGKSTNKEQTARMQYVALSRPKQRIYIRGELPERYFE